MEAGGGDGGGAARPLTPEEEALKRNTDCVYFLASPLTCKKGAECEYRHSEGARVNPRDCWYWLNGNCLNPKCSFRHPPLDGMFGAPATPGIATVPPFQASVPTQMPAHYAAYNMNKQSVPCYYFQKGNCLKGDRCPFSHGPQAAGNNPSEQAAKVSTFHSEPPHLQKKDFWGFKEQVTQQNIPMQKSSQIIGADMPKAMVDLSTANAGKAGSVAVPIEVPAATAKSLTKAEIIPNNMPLVSKSLPTSSDEDHPGYYQNLLPAESGPMQNWNQSYQVPPSDDLPQNSREGDELLGESSPGFDVLVDNDEDESGYLHSEEDFGRTGRDMYPVDDYEYGPADYDLLAHCERDRYNGMVEPDQRGQPYDGYERKRHRASSERNMDRSSRPEWRILQRETDLVEMDRSDLRHRLRKQRRINGSRSAVSPDGSGEWHHRRDDRYTEERHGRRAHRDHHQGPCGSSISSRLQGRIKLPGRSADIIDTHAEKERDRRGLRGRLSPGRPMNFQVRHHERVRRRSSELAASVRNVDSHLARRDDDMESLNFAGPKSLAELKSAKGSENLESDKDANFQGSESSRDFEGPKPLSVILKRKREAALGNGAPSSNGKEDNEKNVVVSEAQSVLPQEADKNGNDGEKEEGPIPAGDHHGQSSLRVDALETEDVIEVGTMEDQELEHYDDQREGESDFEAIQGTDYKSEEENTYQDDDDEFDDEDDFARKVGVMFS